MQDLVKKLAAIMNEKKIMLATAESCTGGLLASEITKFAGASSFFERGFITYSNDAKHEELGVDMQLINTHGAVSQEVAIAMAQGTLKNAHAHISVSLTGIAGPSGGSQDKPLGLVHFATHNYHGLTHSEHNIYTGSRQDIQRQAAETALKLLISQAEQY